MKLISRCLKPQPHSYHRHQTRTAVEADAVAAIFQSGRDRGLDHAVEREKNLRPLINIKNLIKSEPSKSLPVSVITQHKDSLNLSTRPIEFIRKYPSVFEEFLPGGIGFVPHVKLTPEVLDLDADEQLVYQSESYKQNLADRLLKLLMMLKINKIPLSMLDILKWDLGLPENYLETLVPEFPDYFRVVSRKDKSYRLEETRELELVCWNDQLAVSFLENKMMNGKSEYSKGMPIAFPMKFSNDFEMDKKMKKWVDDWQKLPYVSPYVSPYEYETELSPKSEESDKWAAAVLHELLNLFVANKSEKETVLSFGDYLGIRSRFKRVLLQHRGIFYISSKNRTYTVVLRDGYKRGLLAETNPLMIIRQRYIHLMNSVKQDQKTVSVPGGSKQEGEKASKEKDGDNDNSEKNDTDSEDLSDSDVMDDDDSDVMDDDDDDEEEDDEDENDCEDQRVANKHVAVNKGKTNRRKDLDLNAEGESRITKHGSRNRDESSPKFSRGERAGRYNARDSSQERSNLGRRRESETGGRHNGREGSQERSNLGRRRESETGGRHNGREGSLERRSRPQRRGSEGEREFRTHGAEKFQPKFSNRTERGDHQNDSRRREGEGEREFGRHRGKGDEKFGRNFSGRTERYGGEHVRGRSKERSNSPSTRGRSFEGKRNV